jgi:hypothetical protein
LKGPNDRLDGFGVVMSRQAYQDIYFAHIDELAKKAVFQKHLFRQFQPPSKALTLFVSVMKTSREIRFLVAHQMRRSRNQ